MKSSILSEVIPKTSLPLVQSPTHAPTVYEEVTIIGKGAWGTALSSLFKENNLDFSFWTKERPIENSKFLVLALPTQEIRNEIKKIANKRELVIVNCAKGIEQGTHKLPVEIVEEVLGKGVEYYSLIGPSFAEEVVEKMPTLVNLGYEKEENALSVEKLFETDYFRVRPTYGIKALELSAAFKNIYAIAAGIATGLGFGANTRTKIILSAIGELEKLSLALDFRADTDSNPGIIGDLILTCNSSESRNFVFGENLTKYKIKDALEKVGQTVEGYYTVSSVPFFEKKTGVNLPLASFVFKVIEEDRLEKIRENFMNFAKSV